MVNVQGVGGAVEVEGDVTERIVMIAVTGVEWTTLYDPLKRHGYVFEDDAPGSDVLALIYHRYRIGGMKLTILLIEWSL